jgi:ATP phosphoribosyltransferase regulatory subunit HisZ
MQQSVVKFTAYSHRRCSTCFGHYYAHHQELFQTAVAASGFHINVEVDVFPAVVGMLVSLLIFEDARNHKP